MYSEKNHLVHFFLKHIRLIENLKSTLFSIGFPVPKPLLYCSDPSVIGTEFYLMDHVQGRIFHDFAIPGVSPAERSAMYVAMIETLAYIP